MNSIRSSSDFIECRRTLLFTRIILQYIFYDKHKSCKAKTKHYVTCVVQKFKLPTHDTQYTLIQCRFKTTDFTNTHAISYFYSTFEMGLGDNAFFWLNSWSSTAGMLLIFILWLFLWRENFINILLSKLAVHKTCIIYALI